MTRYSGFVIGLLACVILATAIKSTLRHTPVGGQTSLLQLVEDPLTAGAIAIHTIVQRIEAWWPWLIGGLVVLGLLATGFLWLKHVRFVNVRKAISPSLWKGRRTNSDLCVETSAADLVADQGSADGRNGSFASTRTGFGYGHRTMNDCRKTSHLPTMLMNRGTLDELTAGINKSLRQNGRVETGYALVGKINGNGRSRFITVCGLIDAGPKAKRSSGHVAFDRPYQQAELRLLQMVDTEVMHIGDVHLHPGAMDRCSEGDYHTDAANVCASRSQEMVFAIATDASAHRPDRLQNGFIHDGLKLDFFYLGKESGYRYAKVVPEIIDGHTLIVPTQLRQFAGAFPERALLDFDNLRRLRNYRMAILQMPNDDGDICPCIQMTHRTKGFQTIVILTGQPRQPLDVLVKIGTNITRFQASYLDGRLSDLIWFTPIILDVERQLTEQFVAPAGERSLGRNVDAHRVDSSRSIKGEHHERFSATK